MKIKDAAPRATTARTKGFTVRMFIAYLLRVQLCRAEPATKDGGGRKPIKK
jgi:hypothetical protein